MPADSISRLNHVMLLLRQQLASRLGHAKGAADGGAASKATGYRSAQSGKRDLQQVMAQRLGVLRAAGVSNTQVLKRAVIEQVLISGFGEHLVNEPKFQEMVDSVLQTLMQDTEMSELLERLIVVEGS